MPSPPRIRTLTEPEELRALTHPLRVRLLGALRLDGPATASQLARRFGVTSGLTSYHLRALAAHGFVEDDPARDGAGRERWWRAAHDAHRWELPADGDPADTAGRMVAARALSETHARVFARWVEKVARAEPDLEPEWRPAVALSDRWMRLTPERLAELTAEVEAVVERFAAEAAAAEDDPAARRVGTLFAAFPDDGALP